MERSKNHNLCCERAKPHLYISTEKTYGYSDVWVCESGFYSIKKYGLSNKDAYQNFKKALMT